MKEKAGPGCACILVIVLAAAEAYLVRTVLASSTPTDAIGHTILLLEGIGAWIIAAILFFVLMAAYALIREEVSTRLAERIFRQSREYAVRCRVRVMQQTEAGQPPTDLPEEPGGETKAPMYCNMTMTNQALCITARPDAGEKAAANREAALPIEIFRRDPSDPVFISLDGAKLNYIPYKRESEQEYQPAPADPAGHTGDPPRSQNGSQLEIVIVFSRVIQKRNMRKTEFLQPPLKLKFVILDRDGQYDGDATAELYKTMRDRMERLKPSDDDPFVYGSRPIYW